MKKTNLRIGFVLSGMTAGLLAGCTTYVEAPRPAPVVVAAPPPVVVVEPPVTEVVVIHEQRDFYEPLTPYGRWVDLPSYGRCWVPTQVERDWQPYRLGHWQRTDAGWYWVSDEPWGWATYHYGRWMLDAEAGWVWVPQTQWAPAWVSFHQGGGYTGWAPLPPASRFRGDGMLEVDSRQRNPREFVFVEDRKFLQPVRPTTVVVNNTTIINQTVNITNVKIVNNTVINEGPRREIVEKATGQTVTAIAVNDLRRKQEAPVMAAKRITPGPGPTLVHPEFQSQEIKAREDAARRAELLKAQIEAQKKAQEEARLKSQQASERDRLAQEQARVEAQRKSEEAKLKAAQAQAEEKARLAQIDAQHKAKEAEAKAAQAAAEKHAAESKPGAPGTGPKTIPVRGEDVVVHTKAKAAIAAVPELKGVTVATTNGVVHLSGSVTSADHKKKAADLARKVEGVHDVQNNITVKQ